MLRRLLLSLALAGSLAVSANAADRGPLTIPANIQAIMQKAMSGQQPTPAEQKTLTDWGKTMAASTVANAGGAGEPGSHPHVASAQGFSVGSGAAENPCARKGKAIGFGAMPSRDAYLAMVKDALHVYRAHLLPQAQSSLDGVLGGARAPAGGDIAALLIVHASGSAAVVSVAYAAEKSPDDALAANNLGATLRGMHDYARAAIALQYAKSRAPDSPVIASNLGWLAMGQGDAKTASTFFHAATAKSAKLSPALLGEGLIAQCAGKPAQALPLFRASIANGFSDMAEDGIDSAEADIQNSKNSNSDNASPDVYGANAGGDMPDWQDPPFAADVAKFAGSHDDILKYLDYLGDHAKHAASEAADAGLQIKGPQTSGNSRQLVFQRGNTKESFMLGDIRHIFARMTAPLIEKWASDLVDRSLYQDGCHACAGQTELPSCSWRQRVIPIHGAAVSEERSTWTELRKDFDDLYGFSRPLIEQIHDPALARVETAALESFVTSNAGGVAQPIENWQHEVAIDYSAGNCGQAADLPGKARVLKPFKIDPTKCNSGKISMNFGFANLNADCDKMTLTMGEGLVGAAEWKFAPDYTKGADGVLRPTGTDWSNDQVTIFVGAGGGVSGPLAPNGAIGGFVTVQNGQVMDAGGQAQVGISPGADPASLQAGATGRVGIMSGPDVSTSAGVRIGAPCGVSC